jgi:hypothetical protein
MQKLLGCIENAGLISIIRHEAAVIINGVPVVIGRADGETVLQGKEADLIRPLGVAISQRGESVFKVHSILSLKIRQKIRQEPENSFR